MKLIFVRHADPCKENYSITDKGVITAHKLGAHLSKTKIDKIYTGTIARTVETGIILNEHLKLPIYQVDWLNEFKHFITLPNGELHYPWQIPPRYWANNKALLSNESYRTHSMYKNGDIKKYCDAVWNPLDELLKKSGYQREENIYRNLSLDPTATILLVSHFATISVILSHLLNIPLTVMMNSFWMAPASYTVLRTEEIEKGITIFRCAGYGETGYLLIDDPNRSYYGLQPEFR